MYNGYDVHVNVCGRGWMHIQDFIKNYERVELEKYNKLWPIDTRFITEEVKALEYNKWYM